MNNNMVAKKNGAASSQKSSEKMIGAGISSHVKVYTNSESVREILQEMDDRISYVTGRADSLIAIYKDESSSFHNGNEKNTYRIHIYDKNEKRTSVFYAAEENLKPVVELVYKITSDYMVIGELSDVCVVARGELIGYQKVESSSEEKNKITATIDGYKEEDGGVTGIIFARVTTLVKMNEYAQKIEASYPNAMLLVIGSPIEESVEEDASDYAEVFLFNSDNRSAE